MLAQQIVHAGAHLGREAIVGNGGDDSMSGRIPAERRKGEEESSRPGGDGSKEAHGTLRINDPPRGKPPVMAGIDVAPDGQTSNRSPHLRIRAARRRIDRVSGGIDGRLSAVCQGAFGGASAPFASPPPETTSNCEVV